MGRYAGRRHQKPSHWLDEPPREVMPHTHHEPAPSAPLSAIVNITVASSTTTATMSHINLPFK
jgi:hypothetical protein